MAKRAALPPPAHYSALWLRNFRGFRTSGRIPLAPLTFLVGPNSSGKSSLFDALLLVSQSGLWPVDSPSQRPSWAGPLVDLGSYKDTAYGHNSRLSIHIGFEVSSLSSAFVTPHRRRRRHLLKSPFRVFLTLGSRKGDPIGALTTARIEDAASGEALTISSSKRQVAVQYPGASAPKLLLAKIHSGPVAFVVASELSRRIRSAHRLSRGRKSALRRLVKFIEAFEMRSFTREAQRVASGRAAPRRWYPLADIRFRPMWDYIQPRLFDAVDPAMLKDAASEELFFPPRRRKVRAAKSIPAVLRDLEIASSIQDKDLSPYHSSIEVKDSITGVISNLIDVGYGASQVIPVIHACLSGAAGPLFVEQPEIHLHPKAQGTLADLLARTSLLRQVVVETHSVHMINRARIMVARGEIPASHVIVNFVSRSRTGSHVTPIPLLKTGDFARPWPGGFFDERYQDTMQLLSLKV